MVDQDDVEVGGAARAFEQFAAGGEDFGVVAECPKEDGRIVGALAVRIGDQCLPLGVRCSGHVGPGGATQHVDHLAADFGFNRHWRAEQRVGRGQLNSRVGVIETAFEKRRLAVLLGTVADGLRQGQHEAGSLLDQPAIEKVGENRTRGVGEQAVDRGVGLREFAELAAVHGPLGRDAQYEDLGRLVIGSLLECPAGIAQAIVFFRLTHRHGGLLLEFLGGRVPRPHGHCARAAIAAARGIQVSGPAIGEGLGKRDQFRLRLLLRRAAHQFLERVLRELLQRRARGRIAGHAPQERTKIGLRFRHQREDVIAAQDLRDHDELLIGSQSVESRDPPGHRLKPFASSFLRESSSSL